MRGLAVAHCLCFAKVFRASERLATTVRSLSPHPHLKRNTSLTFRIVAHSLARCEVSSPATMAENDTPYPQTNTP